MRTLVIVIVALVACSSMLVYSSSQVPDAYSAATGTTQQPVRKKKAKTNDSIPPAKRDTVKTLSLPQ